MSNSTRGDLRCQFRPIPSLISSITSSGAITIITTSSPHSYPTGLTVRIRVPVDFGIDIGVRGVVGMREIDGLSSPITVIDATSFSMNIDSSTFEPFFIPNPWPKRIGLRPQAVPIGEIPEITAGVVIQTI